MEMLPAVSGLSLRLSIWQTISTFHRLHREIQSADQKKHARVGRRYGGGIVVVVVVVVVAVAMARTGWFLPGGTGTT